MVAIGVVNKYSALDIMDCFKYSREIMADRTNGFLQMMSSNNMLYSNLQLLLFICLIVACNWNGKLTRHLWKHEQLQVLFSKKYNTLENTRSLQVAFWNNDSITQIYGCRCSFEITICLKRKCLLNALYIHNSWLQVLL